MTATAPTAFRADLSVADIIAAAEAGAVSQEPLRDLEGVPA